MCRESCRSSGFQGSKGRERFDFQVSRVLTSLNLLSEYRKSKESQFSRAYLHFKSLPPLIDFSKTYDNHAFVDKQGNEFRAVVEFAPSQRLPKLRKRKDNKQGTIETDPHYAAFLAALGDASLPMPSLLGTADGAAAALNPDAALPQPTETPLVAYIREKRQNAADRKAKRAEKEAEMAKVKLLKRPGAVGAGGGKDKEKGKGAPASLLAPSKSGESGTGKGKRKGKGGAAASTAPEASTPTTDKPPNEPKKPKEKDSKRSKRGANAAAAPAPAQPSSPASATPSSEPTSQPQQPKATPKPKSSFSVVIQKADGTTSSKSLGDQPSSTPSAAEKEVKEVDVTARGVLSVDPAAIAAGKGNKSGRGGRRGGGGRGRGGGGGGAGGAGQGAGEGAG